MKKVLGWFLFSLGIAGILSQIITGIVLGMQAVWGTLFASIVIGIVFMWQGLGLAHPRKDNEVVYVHLRVGWHYHKSLNCEAIQISPDKEEYEAVEMEKLKCLKNATGHQFRPCPVCYGRRR